MTLILYAGPPVISLICNHTNTFLFTESGIILEAESTLVDAQGIPYARLYSGSFNLGAKATGTNFSKRSEEHTSAEFKLVKID